MMYEFGDLLQQKKGILVHQVNCFKMGAGLAEDIARKWPIVRSTYNLHLLANERNRYNLLGSVLFIVVDEKSPLIVANLFGQYNYGNGRLKRN